jgi:predicted enzyme related to lactoylglutathione lyase
VDPAGPLAEAEFKYLFLTVERLEPAVVFYRDVLGLKLLYTDEAEFAFLSFRDPAGPQLALYRGSPPSPSAGAPLIAVNVRGLDDVVAELRGRGVPVSDVHPVPFGRAAELTDPFGNVLELHEPD